MHLFLAFFLGCLTLEENFDRLSRNVGKELPTYTTYYPRRVKASVNFLSFIQAECPFPYPWTWWTQAISSGANSFRPILISQLHQHQGLTSHIFHSRFTNIFSICLWFTTSSAYATCPPIAPTLIWSHYKYFMRYRCPTVWHASIMWCSEGIAPLILNLHLWKWSSSHKSNLTSRETVSSIH